MSNAESSKLDKSEQRKILSKSVMDRIKGEIRNAWNVFKIKEKYNLEVEEYLL
jgi:hypothetical protein